MKAGNGLLVLVQEELARDVVPALPAGSPHEIRRFSSSGDWRSELARIEDGLDSAIGPVAGRRIMVFSSIMVARHIQRTLPLLARGVILQDADLCYHRIAGLAPREWLLNRDFVLLPMGQVAARAAQLRGLYGDRVFLRPDSGLKPFAGDTIALDDIEFEIGARRQINALHGDLLVVIDRARKIASHEYRFWISEGRIITHAGYNHVRGPAPRCPGAILELAGRLARHVEPLIDPVVADFVMDEEGQPRLVEMNAVSTSGFYPGMDFGALVAAMDELML